MSAFAWVAGGLAVALALYLFAVLLIPEKVS